MSGDCQGLDVRVCVKRWVCPKLYYSDFGGLLWEFTGDSQIFITHVLAPHLDGQYTCFGQVIQGLKVVDRIEAGDRIISARLGK